MMFKPNNNLKSNSGMYRESGAGFTLIEAVIYLALFTIIIGGGMVACYQIIQSTDAAYNHIILQEEENFLFGKINWALTGSATVTADASTLTTTKPMFGFTTQLTFSLKDNAVILKRDSKPAVALTTGSVLAQKMLFVKNAGTGGGAFSITSSFSLTSSQNGHNVTEDFSFTKYLQP